MKKQILCLLITLMLISLYAQTLKIMIIDNNKIPVEDAIVNDGYTIQLSDSLGYFRLNTKDKASDYTISKTGFASQTLTKSTLIKRKRIVLKDKIFSSMLFT